MRPASSTRHPLFLPLAAFAAALVVRLVGLGGGSMWLDEIMETLFARGSLSDLWDTLRFDKAVPPLEPLLTWTLLHLGWDELPRRVVNTLFGCAAVALLARWVERRFGRATAAVTALLLATSPVLVRYAHELRPYALALLLFAWALDAADRWIARGGRGIPWEVVIAAGAASTAHYFAGVVWVPIATAWLEARRAGEIERPLSLRVAGAVALAFLPLASWCGYLLWRGGPEQWGAPEHWSLEAVERRLEDLLLRGHGGQPVPNGAALLMAGLALVGVFLLARRRGGATVLAGLVAGTVPFELALRAAGRFSHFRYDQFGLPFLVIAIALTVVALVRTLARWNRAAGVLAAVLVIAAIMAAAATAIVGYARHGRQDWRAAARAVERLAGPETRVVVSLPWVQISLGYYLDRYGRWADGPRDVVAVMNDRARLLEERARSTERCLTFVATWAQPKGLLNGLYPKRPAVVHPETDGLRIYRFAAPGVPRDDCRPPEDFQFETSPGYGQLFPWLHPGPGR